MQRSRMVIWVCLPLALSLLGASDKVDDFGPYNKDKGKNVIYDDLNTKKKVKTDDYGNAKGSKYDLAKDGAFKDYTVAVLHLYTGEGFDFRYPQAALEQKGFTIKRWRNTPPSTTVLARELKKANQLWIISDRYRKLHEGHLRIITDFFNEGKGLYIWGENHPYYADANYIIQALFQTHLQGNLQGNRTVGLQSHRAGAGLIRNHLITTGLEQIFEGITISTIPLRQPLKPLLFGSANQVVAAYYDQGGKRAIIDGGFTRLFLKWDTAGTGRYVKNAAAWLANYERHWKDGAKQPQANLQPQTTPQSRQKAVKPVVVKRSDPLNAKAPKLVAAYLVETGFLKTEPSHAKLDDIQAAIKEFQKYLLMPATGHLDNDTWEALSSIELSPELKRQVGK